MKATTIRAIEDERTRQKHLHGKRAVASSGATLWQSVVFTMEELGELAEAVIERDLAGVKREALHVATCAVAIYEGFEEGDAK